MRSLNSLTPGDAITPGEPIGLLIASDLDSGDDENNQNMAHNFSLTDLDITATNMGAMTCEMLGECLSKNVTLTSLKMGMNETLEPKALKHVFNIMRVYHCGISQLHLNDMPLSKLLVQYVVRIFEGHYNSLTLLNLSSCELTSSHMATMSKHLINAKFLERLILSNNPLEDKGVEYLASVFLLDKPTLLLKRLELRNCRLTGVGVSYVLSAVSRKPTIKYLDISHNPIGNDLMVGGKYLIICQMEELLLNNCNLTAKSANGLFNILLEVSPGRSLSLYML